MNKQTILSAAALLAALPLSAQAPLDALLFSDLRPLSTARSSAVGDAMGALGGDMATMSINPAGLGVYRNSEFIFTPVLTNGRVRSTFSENTTENNRAAFSIGNLGLLFSIPVSEDRPGWKYINFGFTYNRLSSFHQTFGFEGVTPGSRLVNMVEAAQGLHPDDLNPYENQLAYDAFLIDLDGSGTNTYEGALTNDNFVRKRQRVTQSGGLNEFAISMAGNYNHKLTIGGTIGIPMARFHDVREYRETEPTDLIDFKEMTFRENREVRGTGINLKTGFTYRFTPKWRMGMHIHTPTLFGLNETYFTSLNGRVVFNNELEDNTFNSPTARFRHNLSTPWLVGLSGAYVGRYGFIGVDVEHINYSRNRFALQLSDINATFEDRDFIDAVNTDIRSLYGRAWRARVGAELVLGDWRVRGGYRFQGSPYQEKLEGISDLRHDISGGIGIRRRYYFIDLTYVHSMSQASYRPYEATPGAFVQQVNNRLQMGYIMASIAFRFAHPD